MKILDKIKWFAKYPPRFLIMLDDIRIITLSDEKKIKYLYRSVFEKEIDFNNLETFNEKLQWLKLNNKKDEYTKLVDKYEVKKYISEKLGEEYLIKTLGVYEKFDDIDFDSLPNRFVIKCTHDSGGLVICKDKSKLDLKKAKKKINKSLKSNFYYIFREYPYKKVKPRIIIEEYMENSDGTDISDYKFYCFNGKAKFVMICTERQSGSTKFYYYNRNWELQRNMSKDGLKTSNDFYINKPKNLEKMFEIAENLSKDKKFVRVDLYDINEKIYFGEMTFFPSAGFDDTRTLECEKILSVNLELEV